MAQLLGRAHVPPGVKPGDHVRVIQRTCGCVRFRVNGRPVRHALRCAKHGGR
jgi:hypothetical protein